MVNQFVKLGLIVLIAVGLLYMLNKTQVENMEDNYDDSMESEDEMEMSDNEDLSEYHEGTPLVEPVSMGSDVQQACFPQDRELNSQDLLPMHEFAEWSENQPNGGGVLEDKNFLHAGHHVGVNTVGQSLRNANYNLRSEPPNPQVQVSPWIQSTIGPETLRKPMEIGHGC